MVRRRVCSTRTESSRRRTSNLVEPTFACMGRTPIRLVLPPVTDNDIAYVPGLDEVDGDILRGDRYRLATVVLDSVLWVATDVDGCPGTDRSGGGGAERRLCPTFQKTKRFVLPGPHGPSRTESKGSWTSTASRRWGSSALKAMLKRGRGFCCWISETTHLSRFPFAPKKERSASGRAWRPSSDEGFGIDEHDPRHRPGVDPPDRV